MTERCLLVMNPAAGRRHGRDPETVADLFRKHGLAADIAVTERRGHASELVRDRGGAYDVIVVLGGDGTLHEAIQFLDPEHQSLALLPWGTGNDFAFSLGIPSDLEICLERIASGRERRVDLGYYEIEREGDPLRGRFHNQVGFGFEALVNEASHRIRRLHGAAVYVWAFLKTLPRYRTYAVTVESDGERFEGSVQLLAVGNGRRVGGCFRLFPEASLEDGKLDLLHVDPVGILRMPSVFLRMARGTHPGMPGIHTLRAAEIRVGCPDRIPAYVDGEFLTREARSARITVFPGALRIRS